MTEQMKHAEAPPSDSLLVYPRSGLIRLYCPIRVACIKESPPIEIDDIVFVEGISYTQKTPLLYLIRGKFHHFQHFHIINQEPFQ